MANTYAYNGIMQAMQVSMNYGCAPGSTMEPAIGTFLTNIQTSKDSVNQRISAVKESKTSAYHQYQAWLVEQARILVRAKEAQRSNQNTSTAWGARNSIGMDTFYFDDSYKGDLTAVWQASNSMGIDTFYFDDSYRADLAYKKRSIEYTIIRLRPLYETPEDAAKAFSEEVYSASMYIRHEYGAYIYSLTVDGKIMYSYNPPLSGTPHNSKGSDLIPEGATVVAFAHIHPNLNGFSKPDRDGALALGINVYVVGPDRELRLHVPQPNPQSDDYPQAHEDKDKDKDDDSGLGIFISPIPLTDGQRVSLPEEFQESWHIHITSTKCDARCWEMKWPAE